MFDTHVARRRIVLEIVLEIVSRVVSRVALRRTFTFWVTWSQRGVILLLPVPPGAPAPPRARARGVRAYASI